MRGFCIGKEVVEEGARPGLNPTKVALEDSSRDAVSGSFQIAVTYEL